MLGSAVLESFAGRNDCHATDHLPDRVRRVPCVIADLEDPQALTGALNSVHPDAVIHCAALADVDTCERSPLRARAVNAASTQTIADWCDRNSSRLVYVSTDAVFDGNKPSPYIETDPPNPLNVYGCTKLDGEAAVLQSSKGLVLRTNIFGWRRFGKPDLAEWILAGLEHRKELTMFSDVLFSPIATGCLAILIGRAINAELAGLYHAAGAETLSKHEFALRIAAAFSLGADRVRPIRLEEASLLARRPRNLALDSSRFARALGVALPDIAASMSVWKDGRTKREVTRS